MRRTLTITACAATGMAITLGVGIVYILHNPEHIIAHHRDGMNAAAQTLLNGEADLVELKDADEKFQWHQGELVRLEAIEVRTFAPRRLLSQQESSALMNAVIEKSRGLPVCNWHPEADGLHITVWGTEDELREWEAMIDEFQPE